MAGQPRADALSLWRRLSDEYSRYQAVVRDLPTAHLRVQDDLRRYLCLRCAGFLEQVTFVILNGYLEQKAGGPVLHFAKSSFARTPNLNANAFSKLVARFGPEKEAAFEAFLTPVRKESLGSLLGVRNDVAHGKVAEGQRLQPDRYVDLCEEIYEWLIETFLGDSVEVMDDPGANIVTYERTK